MIWRRPFSIGTLPEIKKKKKLGNNQDNCNRIPENQKPWIGLDQTDVLTCPKMPISSISISDWSMIQSVITNRFIINNNVESNRSPLLISTSNCHLLIITRQLTYILFAILKQLIINMLYHLIISYNNNYNNSNIQHKH